MCSSGVFNGLLALTFIALYLLTIDAAGANAVQVCVVRERAAAMAAVVDRENFIFCVIVLLMSSRRVGGYLL